MGPAQRSIVRTASGARRRDSGDAGQFSLRLSPLKKPKDWNSLAELEHQIHLTLGDVVRKGDKLIAEMKEDLDDYSADSLLTDLSGLFKDLAAHREDLRTFMSLNDEGTVYWMEANGNFRGKSLQLYAVPVDVSTHLKELFLTKTKRDPDIGDLVGGQIVSVHDREFGSSGSGR